MDPKRRKELRQQAKEIQRKNSERIHALHRDADLSVPVDDPTWAARYKAGVARQKEARGVRDRIVGREEVAEKFVLNFKDDFAGGVLHPIAGLFVHCSLCGDLIPFIAEVGLECRCGNLFFVLGTRHVMVRSPGSADVVELIGRGT